MSELATGYVHIIPSMQGAQKTIESELGAASGKAGTRSGKSLGLGMASSLKKIIVAAGIGTAVKSVLDEGAKLQQSYIGGVDTLYGDAQGSVRAFAREAAAAGISMNSYSEQAVSFGAALKSAFNNDTTKAAQAANTAILDMADNAAKMGTPLEQIQTAYQGFAKQNYTMLDNLKLGYGGTKTEMERLLKEASKLEKANGKTFDINNLGDVYEAIHLIQDNLGMAGSAADEASRTFSGSFGAMKASAQNFAGSLALGEGVEDSMKSLITSTGTFIFKNFIPMIGQIGMSIPKALAASIKEGAPLLQKDFVGILKNNIFPKASDLTTKAAEFVTHLGTSIENGMPKLAEKLPALTETTMNFIGQNLPKLSLAGLKLMYSVTNGVIKSIPSLVSAVLNGLKGYASGLLSFAWQNYGKSMATKILAPLKGIKAKISGMLKSIKALFPLKLGKIFSNLKLPKISVTKGKAPFGIAGQGSLPKFNIKWNAEGGIFNAPSIIGYGVGEAGAEAIVPLDKFWKKLDALAESVNGGGTQTINIYTTLDGEVVAKNTIKYINGQVQRYGTSPLAV